MTEYTEEQLQEIYKESEAIADILNACEKMLVEEKEGEVPASENNIIRMDGKILTEFEFYKTQPMALDKVISIYHNWAWRLYYVIQGNQGRLKKGKLRDHVLEIFSVVSTIRQILSPKNPEQTPTPPTNIG